MEGVKTDPSRSPRRRSSESSILEVVRAYERGTVTQRELALRHGVCVGTIRNWLRRGERGPSPSAEPWIELIPEARVPSPAGYRIECPGGHVLVLSSGWEAARVRELLQALSGL